MRPPDRLPLPVFFRHFQHPGCDITPLAMKKRAHACLISPTVNDDRTTMLHEMGHAAELHHMNGSDNRGNFMHEADPRSRM